MNRHFAEKVNVCQGFLPVAMNTAANDGDFVSLKHYRRCAIVFYKGAGTAGQDPTITLEQATVVAGSDAKALPFYTVFKKQAATNLLAVGQYTKSTSESPATNDTFVTASGTWTNSTLAEETAIVVIDIDADDLDVANGFCCLRARVADVGTNSQIGGIAYFLHDPRYGSQSLPSAIVD